MKLFQRRKPSQHNPIHQSPPPRPPASHTRGAARPFALALALAVLPVTAVASGVSPAAASASNQASAAGTGSAACAVTWGSQTRTAGSMSTAPLTAVRAGRHACYDRLVLDLGGRAGGYQVGYVDNVHADASGRLVPLRGGARLRLVVRDPATDSRGRTTYTPANPAELADVSAFATFRQVAWAGSFEGQTTLGVGVRARLPFRVFILDGPGGGSRLVVDVAHW